MTMIVIGRILGKPLSPGGREENQEEGVVGAESWVRPTPLLTSTIHHHHHHYKTGPPPPPQNRTIYHHYHHHKTGPKPSDFESDDYGSWADYDDEQAGYDDDDADYKGNGVTETLMQ